MFTSVASQRTDNETAAQFELTIARSIAELEQAFRLVYESYVRAGLQQPNDLGLRLTRHHFLRTTDVMVAKMDSQVEFTASVIVDSELGLPAESMYGLEIDAFRNTGMRLAEVGCLADQRGSAGRFIKMFRKLSTLIAQSAAARGCDGLIAATHPRHSRFYIRQLGFERIGDIRECPYVRGNPAVLLMMDFQKIRGTKVHEHLFGQRFSEEQLCPYEWGQATREHFHAIWNQLHRDDQDAKAVDSSDELQTTHPG